MGMENAIMQAENVNIPVYRTYKDRVFRMLFQEKKWLLELYNALNDTYYTNEEDLTVNTLENVIYMKMKNDISLIIGCDMCLYEHQSSYCPNMPFRGFLYFADLYKKYLGDTELSTSRRVMIPVPRYIVFYNGLERKEEEFTQYLSEFFLGEGGCIEVTVKTININYGHNRDLLEKSPTLNGYARFVSMIRKNLESMSLPQAVENAVTECIRQNILRDFLVEQRNEVVAMSIYEYNEEYAMRVTYEDGENAGYERGKAEGKAEGFRQNLVHNIEAAMKNFGISLEKACAGLDVTVEEYQRAKAQMIQAE